MINQLARARNNGYGGCFSHPVSEEAKMVHFLVYHRWWTICGLSKELGIDHKKTAKFDFKESYAERPTCPAYKNAKRRSHP